MSSVRVQCPHCSSSLKLSKEPEPGRQLTCPKCGRSFAWDQHLKLELADEVEPPSLPKRISRDADDDYEADEDDEEVERPRLAPTARRPGVSDEPPAARPKKFKKKAPPINYAPIVGGVCAAAVFIVAALFGQKLYDMLPKPGPSEEAAVVADRYLRAPVGTLIYLEPKTLKDSPLGALSNIKLILTGLETDGVLNKLKNYYPNKLYVAVYNADRAAAETGMVMQWPTTEYCSRVRNGANAKVEYNDETLYTIGPNMYVLIVNSYVCVACEKMEVLRRMVDHAKRQKKQNTASSVSRNLPSDDTLAVYVDFNVMSAGLMPPDSPMQSVAVSARLGKTGMTAR
ncbi:MAG: hypothetical protein ACRDD1_08995, partial [Planctomycetia bacterium]